jgi:hypothetical protein
MQYTILIVKEQANIIYCRIPTNYNYSYKNNRKKLNYFYARLDSLGRNANPPKKAKNLRAG